MPESRKPLQIYPGSTDSFEQWVRLQRRDNQDNVVYTPI